MHQRHRRNAVTSRLRLRGHDYTSPANYAITICTQHRRCLFGEVRDGVMVLSDAGLVIESWWHFIPFHFPDVTIDAAVVMPNHIHGILMVGTAVEAPEGRNLPPLSRVIQRFKGWSTSDYKIGVHIDDWPSFDGKLWQEGYYEHIIRSDRDLDRNRRYIESNPAQWDRDENNPIQWGL